MNVHLSIQKDIPAEKLNQLFKDIGWSPRKDKIWEQALTVSSYVVSAWHDNELIGFGRIFEDGVMCMFYDIGVHPDFQKKDIGSYIMEELVHWVKDKKYASIGLFVWEKNPTALEFYKKFGFEPVKTGMELVKYMIRE